MKNYKKKILAVLIVLNIAGLAAKLPAAEEIAETHIPAELIARKVVKCNSSLAVPPETVLRDLKEKPNLVLVDVRNKADFERLRIPGSINIPLHAIKTRAFLKSFSIVLVNEGYHYSRLRKTCTALKKDGFAVSILDGGLIGWQHKGGPLTGDLFALDEWREIPPTILFQEKDPDNRIIIDASKVKTAESEDLIPYAIHLPLLEHPERSLQQLKTILADRQNKHFLTVVLFNTDGNHYDRIARMLEKAGIENAFYLKGGLAGYKRFLRHLALSRQPRDSRIKTLSTCKDCGQEN